MSQFKTKILAILITGVAAEAAFGMNYGGRISKREPSARSFILTTTHTLKVDRHGKQTVGVTNTKQRSDGTVLERSQFTQRFPSKTPIDMTEEYQLPGSNLTVRYRTHPVKEGSKHLNDDLDDNKESEEPRPNRCCRITNRLKRIGSVGYIAGTTAVTAVSAARTTFQAATEIGEYFR